MVEANGSPLARALRGQMVDGAQTWGGAKEEADRGGAPRPGARTPTERGLKAVNTSLEERRKKKKTCAQRIALGDGGMAWPSASDLRHARRRWAFQGCRDLFGPATRKKQGLAERR